MIQVHTETNDEAWEVGDKILFLRWMKQESAAIPNTDEEMQALLRSWMREYRRGRHVV